jgi:hypothetical protein
VLHDLVAVHGLFRQGQKDRGANITPPRPRPAAARTAILPAASVLVLAPATTVLTVIAAFAGMATSAAGAGARAAAGAGAGTGGAAEAEGRSGASAEAGAVGLVGCDSTPAELMMGLEVMRCLHVILLVTC